MNFFEDDLPEWCIKKWYEKYHTHYESIERHEEDEFCARSAGQMANFPDAAKDPNSRLRLSRKKWNC